MRKPLLCVTLLLLMSAHVFGQEAGAGAGAPASYGRLDGLRSEAAQLLESQGNRERAWGAYLAGRDGLRESEPALVATLSDPALAFGGEETLVRQAALDALIRLDAAVPAEVLRALPQNFSDEVIILLAKSPGENQAALLEIFAWLDDSGNVGASWLGAANLLAGVQARGLASRLLGGLKVEANVTILDGDVSHGTGLGSAGGG